LLFLNLFNGVILIWNLINRTDHKYTQEIIQKYKEKLPETQSSNE
jgi:hypothetical protein